MLDLEGDAAIEFMRRTSSLVLGPEVKYRMTSRIGLDRRQRRRGRHASRWRRRRRWVSSTQGRAVHSRRKHEPPSAYGHPSPGRAGARDLSVRLSHPRATVEDTPEPSDHTRRIRAGMRSQGRSNPNPPETVRALERSTSRIQVIPCLETWPIPKRRDRPEKSLDRQGTRDRPRSGGGPNRKPGNWTRSSNVGATRGQGDRSADGRSQRTKRIGPVEVGGPGRRQGGFLDRDSGGSAGCGELPSRLAKADSMLGHGIGRSPCDRWGAITPKAGPRDLVWPAPGWNDYSRETHGWLEARLSWRTSPARRRVATRFETVADRS